MATQVNSLYTASIGNKATGDVQVVSSQPALLAVSNTAGVLTFSPTAGGVSSVNGLSGNPVITNADGNLTVSLPPLTSNIDIATTTATNGGTAVLVAQNTGSALAWAGSGSPLVSTVAYTVGAVVIYSGDTYVCLVAQAIGTSFPVNGANWQSIGGGGGGTPTQIANGTSPTDGSVVVSSGGDVSINSGSTGVVLATNASATNPDATGQVVYDAGAWSTNAGYAPGALVSDAGIEYINIQYIAPAPSPATNPAPAGEPAYWKPFTGATSGQPLINPTLWVNTAGYVVGDFVSTGSVASPTSTYVCILALPAPTPPATYPAPSGDPTHWSPIGAPTGAGTGNMFFIGTWATLTAFQQYSIVFSTLFPEQLYIAITSVPATATLDPSQDPTNWQLLSGASLKNGNSTGANNGEISIDNTGIARIETTGADIILNTNNVGTSLTLGTITTPVVQLDASSHIYIGTATGDTSAISIGTFAESGNINVASAGTIQLQSAGNASFIGGDNVIITSQQTSALGGLVMGTPESKITLYGGYSGAIEISAKNQNPSTPGSSNNIVVNTVQPLTGASVNTANIQISSGNGIELLASAQNDKGNILLTQLDNTSLAEQSRIELTKGGNVETTTFGSINLTSSSASTFAVPSISLNANYTSPTVGNTDAGVININGNLPAGGVGGIVDKDVSVSLTATLYQNTPNFLFGLWILPAVPTIPANFNGLVITPTALYFNGVQINVP